MQISNTSTASHRPGGLSNDPEEEVGIPRYYPENGVLGPQQVSRDSVAALMAEAVAQPAASNKIVEIGSGKGATKLPPGPEWFPSK